MGGREMSDTPETDDQEDYGKNSEWETSLSLSQNAQLLENEEQTK